MADVHESHVRSYNMSMIKGKNTKPKPKHMNPATAPLISPKVVSIMPLN